MPLKKILLIMPHGKRQKQQLLLMQTVEKWRVEISPPRWVTLLHSQLALRTIMNLPAGMMEIPVPGRQGKSTLSLMM